VLPGPSADPNEILVRGDGAVDQHHRSRTSAIFVDEPLAEVKKHNGEVLINDQAGTEPVDQERTRLVVRQDTLDLLLLSLAPKPAHGPNHRQRIVVQGLDHQRPFELALAISLVGLGLSRHLLGGQRDGLGQVLDCRLVLGTRPVPCTTARAASGSGCRSRLRESSAGIWQVRES
jgi:hypothetical protein